jgi:hypothetical protein
MYAAVLLLEARLLSWRSRPGSAQVDIRE